jgi:hypothetical protein
MAVEPQLLENPVSRSELFDTVLAVIQNSIQHAAYFSATVDANHFMTWKPKPLPRQGNVVCVAALPIQLAEWPMFDEAQFDTMSRCWFLGDVTINNTRRVADVLLTARDYYGIIGVRVDTGRRRQKHDVLLETILSEAPTDFSLLTLSHVVIINIFRAVLKLSRS